MQHIGKKLQRHRKAHARRFKRWRKHPFGLPIAVFAVLLLGSGLVALVHARMQNPAFHPNTNYIVIISHDGQKQTVPTNAATVGDLLSKLKIPVGKSDRVEPSSDTQIIQDNLRVNIYRAIPVTISDGATATTTYSAAATPRSIVSQSGMTLYPEDRVTAALAQNLVTEASIGERITVERSIPLTLNIYGSVLPLRTHAATVGELLSIKNVHLGKEDSVVPAETTPITPDMQIFVVRKGTQIVTVTQSIPAPVQTVTDASLSFGTSAVRQQGSAGTQVLTYQVNTQNGIEIGRTLLQSVTTVPPVAQIVAQGLAVSIPSDKAAVMAQAGIAASDYQYVDYIMSHEGGWCPTKWQGQHDCPAYYQALYPENSGQGYGIGQATPANKMAAYGDDWRTNVVTQLKWASAYAVHSKGSWQAAYNYWVAHHNW